MFWGKWHCKMINTWDRFFIIMYFSLFKRDYFEQSHVGFQSLFSRRVLRRVEIFMDGWEIFSNQTLEICQYPNLGDLERYYLHENLDVVEMEMLYKPFLGVKKGGEKGEKGKSLWKDYWELIDSEDVFVKEKQVVALFMYPFWSRINKENSWDSWIQRHS